jgi:membrane protein required for colicin V production
MALNAVDIAILLIAVISISVGAWRGFLYEVLSLAGWFVAFFLARWFAADVAALLPMSGASAGLRLAVAFVLVFVGAAFAAGLVSWLVRKLVAQLGLRPVDRLLGAVFGMIRAVLVLVVGGFVVGLTPLAKHEVWAESAGGPLLLKAADAGKTLLPTELVKVLP